MVNKNLKKMQKQAAMMEKLYNDAIQSSCDGVSCGECPFNLGNNKLPCDFGADKKSGCGQAVLMHAIGEIRKNTLKP
jgi:hypothetical protein